MEKLDKLTGTVDRVVFQSADGYSVFKINNNNKLEVVRGSVIGIQPGQELKLEGALNKKIDLLTYGAIHKLLKDRILNEEIRII